MESADSTARSQLSRSSSMDQRYSGARRLSRHFRTWKTRLSSLPRRHQPRSVVENEADLHEYAVLDDLPLLNLDLLTFHPGASKVAERLIGARNAGLDRIFKTLLGSRLDFGDFRDCHCHCSVRVILRGTSGRSVNVSETIHHDPRFFRLSPP